jgi:hypothetical protein
MQFKIEALDNFIKECLDNNKKSDILFENFAKVNEGKTEGIQVPQDIFEAYMKYVDINENEMVSLLEFEKIKSFTEFVEDKKGEAGNTEPDADDKGGASDNDADDVTASTEVPKTDDAAAPADDATKTDDTKTDDTAAAKTDDTATPSADASKENVASVGSNMGAPAPDDKKKEDEEKKDESVAGVGMNTGDDKADKNEKDAKVQEAEVLTPPEKVAAQASAKKDDDTLQTKIDLATGDGSKTAGKIEDAINKLGEPEKHKDAEGEKLIDTGAPAVKAVKEGEVQTPPEKVTATAGEKDNAANGISVDLATGDGSKTAAKVEDDILKMGEPEKHKDAEGEKLVGENQDGVTKEGEEKKTLK